jgi:hypothetical protein
MKLPDVDAQRDLPSSKAVDLGIGKFVRLFDAATDRATRVSSGSWKMQQTAAIFPRDAGVIPFAARPQ